jgi:hypothetical protein
VPRRARALALGALGATVMTTALAATAVPAATGCSTHQCDPSSYDYYGGIMLDANTYATSELNQPWIHYGPNTTVKIHFPNVGRAPAGVPIVNIGTGDEPNGGPDFQWGQNYTPASGQLAFLNFLDSNGMWVTNGSCAEYYLYVQVSFVPSALALFGGADDSGPLGDTFTWDGARWTAHPEATPPGRITRPIMGTVKNRLYLFGGLGPGGPRVDAWSWDGMNWSQVFLPNGNDPTKYPTARYDATSGMAMALDSTGNVSMQLVLFGGHGFVDPQGGDIADLGDTWAFDGTQWTKQPTPVSPPPRSGAAAAGLNGNLVVFGGTSNGNLLSDTWIWNGRGWVQVLADPADRTAPSARSHAATASLPGQVLLFGGAGASGDLGDTWLWDGTKWTQAMPSSSPTPRSSAAMGVYSLAPQTAVLFGGLRGSTALGDTWTWDDTTSNWRDWNVLPNSPNPRGGAVAASN